MILNKNDTTRALESLHSPLVVQDDEKLAVWNGKRRHCLDRPPSSVKACPPDYEHLQVQTNKRKDFELELELYEPGRIVRHRISKDMKSKDKEFYKHPFVIVKGPDTNGTVIVMLITSFGGKSLEQMREECERRMGKRDFTFYLRLSGGQNVPEDTQLPDLTLCHEKKMPKRSYVEYDRTHSMHIGELREYKGAGYILDSQSLNHLSNTSKWSLNSN